MYKTHETSRTRIILSCCGTIIENECEILSVWAKHFEELETSKVDLSSQLKDNVAIMFANSFDRENYALGVPFTVEKIQGIVKGLNTEKSSGPDNIVPEDIIYGSSLLELWLTNIFNAIVECESTPHSFTDAIIVSIYKGKGKNLLPTIAALH